MPKNQNRSETDLQSPKHHLLEQSQQIKPSTEDTQTSLFQLPFLPSILSLGQVQSTFKLENEYQKRQSPKVEKKSEIENTSKVEKKSEIENTSKFKNRPEFCLLQESLGEKKPLIKFGSVKLIINPKNSDNMAFSQETLENARFTIPSVKAMKEGNAKGIIFFNGQPFNLSTTLSQQLSSDWKIPVEGGSRQMDRNTNFINPFIAKIEGMPQNSNIQVYMHTASMLNTGGLPQQQKLAVSQRHTEVKPIRNFQYFYNPSQSVNYGFQSGITDKKLKSQRFFQKCLENSRNLGLQLQEP